MLRALGLVDRRGVGDYQIVQLPEAKLDRPALEAHGQSAIVGIMAVIRPRSPLNTPRS